MYAALLNKKLVLAINEAILVKTGVRKLGTSTYRCPHCQHQVVLVLTQKKTPFFKHLLSLQTGLGEKEEHRQGKLALKTAFIAAGLPARLEVPLAAGQLRADVLVRQHLALEVQCAPLSAKEFYHRHQLYQKIGIFDLWLVGQRHFLKRKLKQTQLIFLPRNLHWGTYLLEINVNNCQLRLKYNLRQEPVTPYLKWQSASFPLDERGLIDLWRFHPNLFIPKIDGKWQQAFLLRQIQRKTKLGLTLARQLYLMHLSLNDLPASLFTKWRQPGEEMTILHYLQQCLS